MYKFSKRSQNKLAETHPDLQILFEQVIRFVDCSIICGHRTEGDQHRAFTTGRSKLKYPLSKHNTFPAMAVDVAPYIKGRSKGAIPWDDVKYFYFFMGVVKGIADRLFAKGGMEHRIRLGGDWDGDNDLDDQSFMDLCHFELVSNI